jgi:hypothetical protein
VLSASVTLIGHESALCFISIRAHVLISCYCLAVVALLDLIASLVSCFLLFSVHVLYDSISFVLLRDVIVRNCLPLVVYKRHYDRLGAVVKFLVLYPPSYLQLHLLCSLIHAAVS